jgi:hypothetical protein
MATISTLAVNLVARTGVFTKNMRRSRKSLYHFQKEAFNAQRRLRNMFRAALALAGIGGLGYLVKNTMKSIDVVDRGHKKLRIGGKARRGKYGVIT